MTDQTVDPAPFLTVPTRLGTEISVTGKWIPTTPDGWFYKSPESREMRKEWEDIHAEAKAHPGVLSTEINHAVGEDAVLIHHVFKNAEAMVQYFEAVATRHVAALTQVARPGIHLVRGVNLPPTLAEALRAKGVDAVLAEHRFGYVKDDYRQPDAASAIMVTAKWTCKEGESIEQLVHWWRQVGTDAHGLEAGLVRYEVYQVIGEDALVIHEVFTTTSQLRYHLSMGTAEKYKKHIDKVAVPECYFFRGPVSWDIRTYSRFLHLPATYSSQGSHYTVDGGTMSDGTLA